MDDLNSIPIIIHISGFDFGNENLEIVIYNESVYDLTIVFTFNEPHAVQEETIPNIIRYTCEQASFCSICLENINIGEEMSALSCEHEFHSICIFTWFKTSTTCPVCRYNVV